MQNLSCLATSARLGRRLIGWVLAVACELTGELCREPFEPQMAAARVCGPSLGHTPQPWFRTWSRSPKADGPKEASAEELRQLRGTGGQETR